MKKASARIRNKVKLKVYNELNHLEHHLQYASEEKNKREFEKPQKKFDKKKMK